MRLKTRNFNWLAGRPVIFLNENTAKKMNVHVDERVVVSSDGKKVYAVVDIFSKIVKMDEVGVSKEISSFLNLKKKKSIDISSAQMTLSGRLIEKKLSGQKLSEKEFDILIRDIVQNNVSEAEIAYFAAAEKLQGMSMKEIFYLTKAMVESGNKLNFNSGKIVADKHCIGGIAGNRTTPLVVSICASAGLTIPKTSSRAITSASGTADVIETIAKVEFSPKELTQIVNKTNACLAWGGSLGLAPSDDKIIHVERLLNLDVEPQLLASIISKKIAAGSKYILIDIPYGKSAKVTNLREAKSLGEKFEQLGKQFNLKLKMVYTDGNQPIGNGFGPVLEMKDILSVLQNKKDCPKDLREKSIFLSSELLSLCGINNSKQIAEEILTSGKAYEKFIEIINAQNNKPKESKDFDNRIKKLVTAKHKKIVYAEKTGKITEIDNKKINSLCRILGTPETTSAGVYIYKHVSDKIKKSEPLMIFYSESKQKISDALAFNKEQKAIRIK